MSKWRDYYRILGVRPDATKEEIKEAWIFGVKAFHPDKFAGSSQRQQAVAQERTKAVNEAYYILSDTIRRANYDREYARNTGAESTSPPPPRSAPAPEPTKTASSTDTSAKDNGAQATHAAKTGSPGEQNPNEPLSTVLYRAGLYIAWLVAAAMLVSAAVERHPYGFYTLLRLFAVPFSRIRRLQRMKRIAYFGFGFSGHWLRCITQFFSSIWIGARGSV